MRKSILCQPEIPPTRPKSGFPARFGNIATTVEAGQPRPEEFHENHAYSKWSSQRRPRESAPSGAVNGSTGGSDDAPPDLCSPFLDALPVSGVSVTVMAGSGLRSTLCSSGSVAIRVDELHLELGGGPQSEALRTGTIIAIPDLATDGHTGWPLLGRALHELGVGALFAIPLQMGAVTVGVVTLLRDRPGDLTPRQRAAALAIASASAVPAAIHTLASADREDSRETPTAPALRREVHQATGVVLARLGISATDAFARLQAYSFATGRSLLDVAHDVVAGTLALDDNDS